MEKMYLNKKNKISFFIYKMYLMLFCLFIFLSSGCKKFVETDAPTTSITGKTVFSTDPTAIAVLTGIYTKMSGTLGVTAGELTSIGFLTGLSSDELTLYAGINDTRLNYYQNNIDSQSDNFSLWNIIYPKIYICNSAIEGISDSQSLSSKVKEQLLGEAKFMRAFCYFYLVNLYGDVPLVLSSNFSLNLAMSRTSKDLVWKQIIQDLQGAQSLLSEDYLDITLARTTLERVRPTKGAATAFLSRAFLFIKDWKNAEIESSKVINNSLYHLETLNDVFKNRSAEAIWQLQPVNVGFNTEDARSYIITDFGPGSNGGAYISNQLLNGFEEKDRRKMNWIGVKNYEGVDYHYPYKYKLTDGEVVNEYHTIFRLAEQYLIRAEARTEQNNISGAIEDVDVIRNRAGLLLLKNTNPGISISDLKTAILLERQHELFTEWGHRWLDLKRTNTINSVMNEATPLKGGIWNSNSQLYPIPPNDILKNRNIIQNPGYQ